MDIKFGYSVVNCQACKIASIEDRKFCHECGGKGFIEYFNPPDGCTMTYPICPIESEPMVGGYYCSKCGKSGPVSSLPLNDYTKG